MRQAQLVSVVVFGLFLAGCGAPAGSNPTNTDKPTAASTTAPRGTVQGQILRPPGPDPRSGKVGTTVPVSGDPVHAKDSNGNVVASAVSGPDGHFKLTLPPGSYEIGEDTCGVSQKIEIQGGATTSVRLSLTNAC
jgi:hypothetical protein